jgi:hypothetical protein
MGWPVFLWLSLAIQDKKFPVANGRP